MTELVFILDRSGSMSGMETDTIGGFNSMINAQREGPGRAMVTTVLFDHERETLHDRIPLDRVPKMTDRHYYVRGCTALLDAVGSTIRHIEMIHRYARPEDRPRKTLFVITTDGMENASREYDYDRVRRMIEAKKDEGWEFIFLGANIDAAKEGARFGLSPERTVTYNCDSAGTALNFEAISDVVSSVRSCGMVHDDWKANIEADYAARKKP